MENTIYLWGDSIGKGVIYDAERQRYCLAPGRCTAILRADGLRIECHARMGATIRDGYADFCAAQTRPGGLVVIEYGGNDCDLDWDAMAAHPACRPEARTPLREFAELTRLFILEARRRQLRPVLAVPPPLLAERYFDWVTRCRDRAAVLRGLGDVQHIYRWQERYARATAELARELGCPLLDLRAPFLDADDFPALMCADGIHPNEAGQELMARASLARLRRPAG